MTQRNNLPASGAWRKPGLVLLARVWYVCLPLGELPRLVRVACAASAKTETSKRGARVKPAPEQRGTSQRVKSQPSGETWHGGVATGNAERRAGLARLTGRREARPGFSAARACRRRTTHQSRRRRHRWRRRHRLRRSRLLLLLHRRGRDDPRILVPGGRRRGCGPTTGVHIAADRGGGPDPRHLRIHLLRQRARDPLRPARHRSALLSFLQHRGQGRRRRGLVVIVGGGRVFLVVVRRLLRVGIDVGRDATDRRGRGRAFRDVRTDWQRRARSLCRERDRPRGVDPIGPSLSSSCGGGGTGRCDAAGNTGRPAFGSLRRRRATATRSLELLFRLLVPTPLTAFVIVIVVIVVVGLTGAMARRCRIRHLNRLPLVRIRIVRRRGRRGRIAGVQFPLEAFLMFRRRCRRCLSSGVGSGDLGSVRRMRLLLLPVSLAGRGKNVSCGRGGRSRDDGRAGRRGRQHPRGRIRRGGACMGRRGCVRRRRPDSSLWSRSPCSARRSGHRCQVSEVFNLGRRNWWWCALPCAAAIRRPL